MSKQTPTSFEAASSVIDRLYSGDVRLGEPADARAVIFSAIIQARAIDRLTKAVEKNTRAVMLAGHFSTAHIARAREALDDPKWEGR